MKVILTHEHADFDAIASMLAMHKLEPEAKPVLPQRVNRNVSQFLVLYAGVLPTLRVDEITSRDTIELAYVVDTQAYNMVRGMNPQTPISYIDHHPLDKPLDDHHQYSGEPLGANTTLLVEQMIERGLTVTSLEATLLLLGIYEDTGSLTYRGTTSRDLKAAAWLLEHEANLDVVRRFLRHPLSEAQQVLYDRLAESTILLDINGYNIAVSSATLIEEVEEVATLAHQLRELFDCDALFIVIQLRANVQIIARSVSDHVDVGAIIRQFGGGGHERAAAVLIRNESMTSILCRLIDSFPTYVSPAVLVADMMSWGVQSVEAETSVEAAHRYILDIGHEGYPVLQNGELVGLLTRRAVDHAMRHHMQNLTVSDIMEAGNFSVRPRDSIETLKDQMLDSGWGQMPVTNLENEVIGIVTRTDLIKRWGQRSSDQDQQRREEMLNRLQSSLPAALWSLLETITDAATGMGYGLFLVGGIVRDLLLGRPNLDIDLVVEGDAIALAKKVCQQYGGLTHKHVQFGTAKWRLDGDVAAAIGYPGAESYLPKTIDFATSRAEFYEAPTVLPTVRRSSIKLDLHRRDFTINTLAIRLAPSPHGELLDFYKGEEDLRDGIIRVLHSLSFVDDPTRILRAVRFEQRFKFTIDPRSLSRLKAALPLIDRVSGDRIRHELNLILAEPNALQAMDRLDELGILEAIHPLLDMDEEVWDHYATLEQIRKSPPWALGDFDDWRILAFSLLVYDLSQEDLEALSRRLLMPRRTLDQLLAIRKGVQLLNYLPGMQPSEVVIKLEPLGQTAWLAVWLLGDQKIHTILRQFVEHWQHIQPTIGGNDLIQMGVPRGPAIGFILHELRAAWLNNKVTNHDDEQRFTQTLISQHTA